MLDSDEMDRVGIDLGVIGRLQLMVKLVEGRVFEWFSYNEKYLGIFLFFCLYFKLIIFVGIGFQIFEYVVLALNIIQQVLGVVSVVFFVGLVFNVSVIFGSQVVG